MLRRTFFAITAVLALAATANAGSVYVYVVTDPATTAGAGIVAIPGGGANMAVSSNKSGAGSFQVYAVDDADGSAGLRSFFMKLNGTVSGVLNRSPNANFDTDPTYGDGTQSNVGFDFSRTTTPLLGGVQSPGNTVQVGGFGQTASNFQLKTSAGSYQAAPTSGQWGLYSPAVGITSGVVAASGHVRNAILLGEGLYTGAAPTVDITTAFDAGGTGFSYFFANGFPAAGSDTVAVGTTQTLQNINPFGAIVPEPATLTLVGLAVLGFCGIGRRRS